MCVRDREGGRVKVMGLTRSMGILALPSNPHTPVRPSLLSPLTTVTFGSSCARKSSSARTNAFFNAATTCACSSSMAPSGGGCCCGGWFCASASSSRRRTRGMSTCVCCVCCVCCSETAPPFVPQCVELDSDIEERKKARHPRTRKEGRRDQSTPPSHTYYHPLTHLIIINPPSHTPPPSHTHPRSPTDTRTCAPYSAARGPPCPSSTA